MKKKDQRLHREPDPRVRRSLAKQAWRLQPVQWLILAQMARQQSITEHVAPNGMNEEQRTLRAERLDLHERRPGQRAGLLPQQHSKRFDRSALEQRRQRQRLSELLAQLSHETHSQQRVPSEFEEIIVDSNRRHIQHILEDLRQLQFEIVTRIDQRCRAVSAPTLRRG